MSGLTIKVGEREFFTTRETLSKSRYLTGVLGGGRPRKGQQDQPVRIDRDGDMFEHILRYLRTDKAPLFYDHMTKFDEVLYDRLRTESDFYGCYDLSEYLQGKKYRDAVNVCQYMDIVNDHEQSLSRAHPLCPPLERGCQTVVHACYVSEKLYECPYDILQHMDQRSPCDCHGHHFSFQVHDLRIIIVHTHTLFHPEALQVSQSKLALA